METVLAKVLPRAEGGDSADQARAAKAAAEESMEVDGAAAADDRRAEHNDGQEEKEGQEEMQTGESTHQDPREETRKFH